ncbi:MAG: hypothetical protein JSU65_01730 [Candidatus Zixiibacteriota bacterium]|nr:MAG: hypothetical protein JSU65_01730 [candidate division Zixibacteria bacterium]
MKRNLLPAAVAVLAVTLGLFWAGCSDDSPASPSASSDYDLLGTGFTTDPDSDVDIWVDYPGIDQRDWVDTATHSFDFIDSILAEMEDTADAFDPTDKGDDEDADPDDPKDGNPGT